MRRSRAASRSRDVDVPPALLDQGDAVRTIARQRRVSRTSSIVEDLDRARTFYGEALGIDSEGSEEGYAFTERLDGVKHLGLWPLSAAADACFGNPIWPAGLSRRQASIEFEGGGRHGGGRAPGRRMPAAARATHRAFGARRSHGSSAPTVCSSPCATRHICAWTPAENRSSPAPLRLYVPPPSVERERCDSQMQLVDDRSLLPPWLPRPGASTVGDHVPLDVYPEVVRLPLMEPPGTHVTWPQPLRAIWRSLRLCDVLDAPAPFTEGPSDAQTTSIVRLVLHEEQRFWFLIAERNDEVEWFVRHDRLGLQPDQPRRGRRLQRVLGDLAVDARSVSEDPAVSRYWLATGTGPRDADVALTQLSSSHLWTDGWLLRLHEWREEQSMLVAGPAGVQDRLASAGLPNWAVDATVPWPPGCQGDHDRHFGLAPPHEA